MKHSDLKRILEKHKSSKKTRAVLSNIMLSLFHHADDLEVLQRFYRSCLLTAAMHNNTTQDIALFPGQLFQLYGQILLTADGKTSYFRNAILDIETPDDKEMRIRIELIKSLGCLPSATIQTFDYVLLGRLIKHLPLNLFKVEILQSIFDACNTGKTQLAEESYLMYFPLTNLMTEANFKVLGASLGYSSHLGIALDKLPRKMLTQYYFDALTKPDELEPGQAIDLDDQEPSKSEKLCFVINLMRSEFLDFENFYKITEYLDILYGANLHKIARGQFTHEVFDHIMGICEKEFSSVYTKQVIIRNYIQKIRGELDHPNINNHESSETESIHSSVCEAAIKMWKQYGSLIDTEETLENKIREIKEFLIAERNQLTSSNQELTPLESEYLYQINKAIVCFIRIFPAEKPLDDKDIPYGDHFDERNNITLKQMLALQFIAIHDESLRQGTLTDALKKFAIALYDMQRGKNQDDYCQDDRTGFDIPICKNGHINKAAEITWGTHPLTDLVFIDPKVASAKFPVIVKEEVDSYLLTVKKLESAQALKDQIIAIKATGMKAIWSKVEKPVMARLLAEFSTLFPRDQDLQKFVVASYPDVDVRDEVERYCGKR